MRILVIDIGGSNVKLLMDGGVKQKFKSGRTMTPGSFITQTKALTKDWKYDAVSIGFPAPVVDGRLLIEPKNLGRGWKGFKPAVAFRKPAKVVNDAAMQALGSYNGGRMLFLGLGTGLGSALVLDGVIVPLELCDLPYSRNQTLEDVLGKASLKRLGAKSWEELVHEIVGILRKALLIEDVVLGGGNVKKLAKLPPGARAGGNENAYLGGLRLWKLPQHSRHREQNPERPNPALSSTERELRER